MKEKNEEKKGHKKRKQEDEKMYKKWINMNKYYSGIS